MNPIMEYPNASLNHLISRRRAFGRLAGGGLALTLASRGLSVTAQEATPAEATGLPEGVSVVTLPPLTPFALPEEPGAVQVIWLTMEPDTAVPVHPHPFSEFAFMLSGTAMFMTEEGPPAQVIRAEQAGTEATPEVGEPGTEVTAHEGDVVIFPSGNVSDTRAAAKGATILVLEIVTHEGEATPED
jgi:quercetin dioxygenase-like cupin family protein